MITREAVLKALDYDEFTGIFKWKIARSRRVKVGSEAGCVKLEGSGKSYRRIRISGRSYYAHRLTWLVITGQFPEHEIYHINGDGLDNRSENLRAVPHLENEILSREDALKVLDYDPVTGIFIWKTARSGVKFGREAGTILVTEKGKSYRHIRINGRHYYSHRLAWLILTGQFPNDDIDHINGDGLDNRSENLRAVTRKENCKNQRKRITNTSGVTGVYREKRSSKWCAEITLDKKKKHLGLFDNFDEAVIARKNAERLYDFYPRHGETRPL